MQNKYNLDDNVFMFQNNEIIKVKIRQIILSKEETQYEVSYFRPYILKESQLYKSIEDLLDALRLEYQHLEAK